LTDLAKSQRAGAAGISGAARISDLDAHAEQPGKREGEH